MLFNKKDFKDLKYSVFEVDKNILANLNELQPYAALLIANHLQGRPDEDNLIRYTMALYDKKSPLIKQLNNISLRKIEAALSAGYDLKRDEVILNALYDFTDPALQLLVIEFLREQNDMYYSMIVSNEQTFYEYQKALLTKVENFKDDKQKMDTLNVKSKLMDECDKIATRVEQYYIKVFSEGEVQAKAKQLRNFSPEMIANRAKNV